MDNDDDVNNNNNNDDNNDSNNDSWDVNRSFVLYTGKPSYLLLYVLNLTRKTNRYSRINRHHIFPPSEPEVASSGLTAGSGYPVNAVKWSGNKSHSETDGSTQEIYRLPSQ